VRLLPDSHKRPSLTLEELYSVESTFPGWLDEFYTAIDPLAPTIAGLGQLSISGVPPARIQLEKVSGDTLKVDPAPPPWASDVRWAKLRDIERTTAPGWYQDVRAVELEIEGFAEEQVL
jgi:hypothetical protein